jgi:hypothetical protein
MMKRFFILTLTLVMLRGYSQDTNAVSGVFNCYVNKVFSNGAVTTLKTANAYFAYNAATYIDPADYASVGNVQLNQSALVYDQSSSSYADTTLALPLDSMAWDIAGNQNFPGLSFTYSGGFPSGQLLQNLPDTLKKSDTLHLDFSGLTAVDSIYINVWDSADSLDRKFVQFKYGVNSASIDLTPDVLLLLRTGGKAFFSVELVNYQYQAILDRKYLFCNHQNFIKPSIYIANQ